MSVTAIVGTPGAGKSYSAVHLSILPAIRGLRPVYTNIPLYGDVIREDMIVKAGSDSEKELIRTLDIVQYDPEKLDTAILRAIPGGSLIVLDEIWRYWPSELKQLNKDDESFFAEHRHRTGRIPGTDGMVSQDIVILTQDMSDIPRPIRSRIAATFIVTKLTAVGAESRFRVDRYQGAVSSMRPNKAKLITTSYGQYQSEIWRYYQSHTKGSDTCGVDLATVEAGSVKNKSVFSSPAFIAIVLFLALAIPYLAYRFFFSERGFLQMAPVSAPVEEAPAPQPVRSVGQATDLAMVPLPPGTAQAVSTEPAVKPEPPPGAFHGYWITGSVIALDSAVVFVTNGVSHKSVRPKKDTCFVDSGMMRCLLDGEVIDDIPKLHLASRGSYFGDNAQVRSGVPLPAPPHLTTVAPVR